MRRKNPPKSHMYMILGLLIVILGVAGFVTNNYFSSDTPLAEEITTPRTQTSLNVKDGDGLHQGAQSVDGSVLQSSTMNIQSAEGVDVYENYDSQNSSESEIQPQ